MLKVIGAITGILVLVVLLIGYFLWPLRQGEESTPGVTPPVTEASTSVTKPVSTPVMAKTSSLPNGPFVKTPGSEKLLAGPTTGIKPEKRSTIVVDDNGNVAINMWGRVVDEMDQPIPSVMVHFSVRGNKTMVPPFEDTMTKRDMVTGADGRFEIRGVWGRIGGFEISKEGYELSKKANISYNFTMSDDVPPTSPDNPLIVRMWKKRGRSI